MKTTFNKKFSSVIAYVLSASMLLSNVNVVIAKNTASDETSALRNSVLDEYYAERDARKADILRKIEENEAPEKWNVFLRLSGK